MSSHRSSLGGNEQELQGKYFMFRRQEDKRLTKGNYRKQPAREEREERGQWNIRSQKRKNLLQGEGKGAKRHMR